MSTYRAIDLETVDAIGNIDPPWRGRGVNSRTARAVTVVMIPSILLIVGLCLVVAKW